jgi:hypothetical protein
MAQQDILAFLKQAEEVCRKATKGEWYWDGDLLLTKDPIHLVLKPYYDDDTGEVSTCIFDNDKNFIVTAHAALLRALEIIKQQAERIAELEKEKEV